MTIHTAEKPQTTEAEWFLVISSDKREDGYIREVRPTEDGRHLAVARVADAGRGYSEKLAIGRLIANAPEVLAALKALLAKHDSDHEGLSDLWPKEAAQARDAIAKVEGR